MKISMFGRFVFGMVFISLVMNSSGFDGKDTISQYIINSKTNDSDSLQDSYSTLLSRGFSYVASDSIKQGIESLVAGFEKKNELDKSDRIADLSNNEFLAILNMLNSGKLNKEEQEIGYHFIKETIVSSYPKGEPNLDNYISKNPKSVFANRLKFLYLINKPNSESLDGFVDKLLKLDSSIVSANLYKARLLGIEGKYEASIRYFTSAIHFYPQYALAFYLRAISFEGLEKNENAQKDYDMAIELYPDYFDAYNNRGNVKSKLGKHREALADYKKAIDLKPDIDYPYNNIALVYKQLNMPDSALIYLQDALDVNPRNAQVFINIGDIYLRRQDYGSAVSNFTKSINLEPSNKMAYLWRGDAYFFDNKEERAMEDYSKVIELDKDNAYALMRLGDCNYQQKDYLKAIDYYSKSQKIYPDNIYLLISKGLCYNQTDKNEEAKDCLVKALAIDSTNSAALGNLGWVYYCLGDFKNCIIYSNKAIKYQSDAFYAMFNVAISTLRMGKYDESIELYKKYIAFSKSQVKENLDGAMSDLKDLIKKNIMVKESTYILENLFQK
jgi:tetratricopeptide (TPR) repeat protein